MTRHDPFEMKQQVFHLGQFSPLDAVNKLLCSFHFFSCSYLSKLNFIQLLLSHEGKRPRSRLSVAINVPICVNGSAWVSVVFSLLDHAIFLSVFLFLWQH